MTDRLGPQDHAAALVDLVRSGWTHDPKRDSIAKTFVFRNFVEAFGFMTRAALWAEKWDHHPEWSNVYKTVNVTLTTHSADGLTELDVKLARKLDSLASPPASLV